MLSIILIAFISLIGLLILHELSHFLVAKKFGVAVEEFGIGYPPRIIGKKIGDTIYSLNLIPFGAFVKIDEQKLKHKPIWQRALIIIAGIVSFWLICIVIISVILSLGAPVQVSDNEAGVIDPKVQIVAITPNSPAEKAHLQIGDTIQQLTPHQNEFGTGQAINNQQLTITKVQQIQELTKQYAGEEIILTILRGNEVLEINIVPRVSPPENEGPLGVGLARIAVKKYALFQAFWQAFLTTTELTWQIILGLFGIIKNLILGRPSGAEFMGPVGIFDIFVKAGTLGIVYFLQTIALISLNVAVINALPIPVADGGRLLLLAIEKIRKKPLNEKLEEKINTVFFGLLIALMIWVTIKDISRIF